MKRFIKRTLAVSLILSVLFIAAADASGLSLTISRYLEDGEASQAIIIEGKFPSAVYGERATVKAYKKSSGTDIAFGDYALLYEEYINEDGSFRFSPLFAPEEDTYSFVVSSLSGKLTGEIYVPSLTAAEELISGINDESLTNAEILESINENAKELAMDVTVFENLSKTAQSKVVSDMLSANDEINIENLYTEFGKYTLINALNEASSADKVKDALDHYDYEYLSLGELHVNELKESLTQTKVNDAYGLMRNCDFESVEDIKERYTEAFILSAYKNIDAYANLYEILEEYAEEIGIEDKLSSLSANEKTKNAVLRYLVANKSSVDTLEELENKITYALSNLSTILGQDSTAPSGGGGGGGGGKGGSFELSPDYVASNTEDGSFAANSALLDLNSVPWAEAAIRNLFSKGIVNGRGDGNFAPNDKVTRAEMAKMLVQSMDIYDENAESKFADTKNHWSNKYVASAYKKGFINGLSRESFGADLNITRQDAAVMIYRIIQTEAKALKIVNVTKNFADMDKVSDYAINSVKMLAEYGIINGFSDGSFKPSENLTRAEAAVIINNYLKFVEEGI